MIMGFSHKEEYVGLIPTVTTSTICRCRIKAIMSDFHSEDENSMFLRLLHFIVQADRQTPAHEAGCVRSGTALRYQLIKMMKTFSMLKEEIRIALDDRLVLEMGNMQPRHTGLTSIVHIIHKGGSKHSARVKVSNIAGTFHPKDNFTITAEHEPRVIGNCKLKKNYCLYILTKVGIKEGKICKKA